MTTIEPEIRRSRRRTIEIEITNDALVIVRAPFHVSERYIMRFISQKEAWILRNQRQAAALKRRKPQYQEGEQFLFLGETYPLIVTEKGRTLELKDGGFHLPGRFVESGKETFIRWYKKQLELIVRERVSFWCDMLNVSHGRISITKAERQWGSCSHINNLNFSYRLAMTPYAVIDYVVLHEVAHIVHKNHSRRFWNLVSRHMPQYKRVERWMKQNDVSL